MPRRIMNKDDVGICRVQRFKARMHLRLTRRSAFDGRGVAKPPYRSIKNTGIIRIHDRLHGGYLRMGRERVHRPIDDGLSTDRTILLRAACTGAQAATCGNEDGGSPRLVRHRF